MKPWLSGWLLEVVPNASTQGLRFLARALRTPRPYLIRGDFSEYDEFSRDGRGCLLHWLGKFHPGCRDDEEPAFAFAELVGWQHVDPLIGNWDGPEWREFRRELIRVIRAELSLRRRLRAVPDAAVLHPTVQASREE